MQSNQEPEALLVREGHYGERKITEVFNQMNDQGENMAVRTLNKVFLIGNIVRKPEVNYTRKNIPASTFHLITNREWTTSNGEYKTQATKHICLTWDKLAEIANKLLDKGTLVYVEGRLENKENVDGMGNRTEQTVVMVDELIVLSNPPKDIYE